MTGLLALSSFFHSVDAIGPAQSTPPDQPLALIAPGEKWSYFAYPREPEPSWNLNDFNDNTWQIGQAPLGYGSVGETTVIDSGPNPTGKYTTSYFRKTFNVDNPALIDLLTLEMMHSDGAFIYLNGVLVDYPHMGSEGPSYSVYAIACDNGETDTISIDPSRLVPGENVLAVEIHVCKPDSQYLIFDAGLTSGLLSSTPTATGTPTVTPTQTPTAAPTTAIQEAGGFLLFGREDTWRYSDLGQRPGSRWVTAGFDDSAWKSGRAPFGYGNVGETTHLEYGPNPDQKYITTYFRKDFSVDNPKQVQALKLELITRDGAVVYLNGAMIAHPNMPDRRIRNNTIPTTCGNEIATLIDINPALLAQGKNVVALEQHQCSPGATNLIVDASMGALLYNGQPKPANFPNKTPIPVRPSGLRHVPTWTPVANTPIPAIPGLPAAPEGQRWELHWGDEFDGSAVDTTKWKINNKKRAEDPNKTWYIPQNVSVSDGKLKLLVKQETYKDANYTGGMLELTGAYRRNRYGYYEARIQYDFVGPGFWANFWLCGVDRWPPEIDSEIVTHEQGLVYLANHYRDAAARHRSANTFMNLDYNQWHTYGVLWLPDKPVQFYIDGKLAFTANSPAENPPAIDMYVSLRAGAFYNSGWGGTPDGITRYPGVAVYDYVRVYQAVGK